MKPPMPSTVTSTMSSVAFSMTRASCFARSSLVPSAKANAIPPRSPENHSIFW